MQCSLLPRQHLRAAHSAAPPAPKPRRPRRQSLLIHRDVVNSAPRCVARSAAAEAMPHGDLPGACPATEHAPRKTHTQRPLETESSPTEKGFDRPTTRSSAAAAAAAAPRGPSDRCDEDVGLARRLASAAFAALASAGVLLGTPLPVPATVAEQEVTEQKQGGQTILRLPASSDPDVYDAQATLLEAWSIAGETFVDEELNGRDWGMDLRDHMVAAFHTHDASVAHSHIDEMLAALGDPYTRRVDGEHYQRFRVDTDGELQGVGLLIARTPTERGGLLVLAPIRGSPADRAGVLPGDELLTINGIMTKGLSGDEAAQLLRGYGGSEVRVKLARSSDEIPGVAGRPAPPPSFTEHEVSMRREHIDVSPLYATALPLPPPRRQPDAPVRYAGYLRLSQFSNNAAAEMEAAIQGLEAAGVDEYILDLRNNPGGLVSSSIELAQLFLDGNVPVFNVMGRNGAAMVQTTQHYGPALTHKPLAVLVNANSASASEILSGALRDNGRATVVGPAATFGKGRIQSVFELHDGSALFVTVAKYVTPSGVIIDRRGITPDVRCVPSAFPGFVPPSGSKAPAPPGGAAGAPPVRGLSLKLPGAVQQVLPPPDETGFSPGLPLGPAMEAALAKQLGNDRCVAAAEDALTRDVAKARREQQDAQLRVRQRANMLQVASAPAIEVQG